MSDRDHVVVYVGDNGPWGDCIDFLDSAAPVQEMLQSMVKVGYYGRLSEGAAPGRESTSFNLLLGPGRDWRPGFDIQLPMFNAFHKRPDPPG